MGKTGVTVYITCTIGASRVELDVNCIEESSALMFWAKKLVSIICQCATSNISLICNTLFPEIMIIQIFALTAFPFVDMKNIA